MEKDALCHPTDRAEGQCALVQRTPELPASVRSPPSPRACPPEGVWELNGNKHIPRERGEQMSREQGKVKSLLTCGEVVPGSSALFFQSCPPPIPTANPHPCHCCTSVSPCALQLSQELIPWLLGGSWKMSHGLTNIPAPPQRYLQCRSHRSWRVSICSAEVFDFFHSSACSHSLKLLWGHAHSVHGKTTHGPDCTQTEKPFCRMKNMAASCNRLLVQCSHRSEASFVFPTESSCQILI